MFAVFEACDDDGLYSQISVWMEREKAIEFAKGGWLKHKHLLIFERHDGLIA